MTTEHGPHCTEQPEGCPSPEPKKPCYDKCDPKEAVAEVLKSEACPDGTTPKKGAGGDIR